LLPSAFADYRVTMPIYEFECTTCSTHFDRLQKLSDPDPAACPECGKATIRRCVTAPSFRLAGSGWYETDFKKDGDKKRNLVEKAEPKKTEDKPATDSKVAAAKTEGGKPASGGADGGKAPAKPAEKAQASKPDSKPAPTTGS
jgi:putative FmdB family regulatory protein